MDDKPVTKVDATDFTARVDRIYVDGLCRTKDDIVTRAVHDLFHAKTFQQLLEKSIEVRLKLEKLSCFKSISIEIDTSKGPNSTKDYGYDVTFIVTELKKITGRLNTSIENNQGSVGLVLQTPNLLGRGECIQAEGRYSSKKMQQFNLSFAKPLFFYDGKLLSSFFKQNSENIASGYKLVEYGTILDLCRYYTSEIKHSISWEGIIRNTSVLNRNVAFPIREQSGYSLKSSVNSNINIDTRNSTIFPESGSILQMKTELAGLGGDTGFLKNELFYQFNLPIVSDIIFQGSFGAGIMNATTKDKHYSIIDHFFLGGPLTLRGFHFNSVGPKVDGYALGGSSYWVAALHIYTSLPHNPKKGSFGDLFRTHFFCNAGNVADIGRNISECLGTLGKNFRLSYGLGLMFKLGQVARIELNYCFPIFYSSDDKLVDGVQLGVGMHFV